MKPPPVTEYRKTSPEEASSGLSGLGEDEQARKVLREYFETGNAMSEKERDRNASGGTAGEARFREC
jgi:hypothetical protein